MLHNICEFRKLKYIYTIALENNTEKDMPRGGMLRRGLQILVSSSILAWPPNNNMFLKKKSYCILFPIAQLVEQIDWFNQLVAGSSPARGAK